METSKTTVTTTDQPAAASRGLRQAMAQHPLLSFVIMAYTFSWIMTIPFILSEWHVLPGNWNFIFIIKAYAGPSLAAFIMIGIIEGKEGVRRWLRRLVQWRQGWHWYVVALLGIPAFFLLGVALMPGALASFTGITSRFYFAYPITFVIIALVGGPLAEEPGWRGFALPRLLERFEASPYGALKASLALGVIWTFWHLPDFLTSAQHGGPGAGLTPFFTNLPIFFLMVMAITMLFTWVFNHTHGSIFMAVLLHASINTLGSNVVPLFPVPAVLNTELPELIGWGVLALLVVVLTRGRLGYQPRQE